MSQRELTVLAEAIDLWEKLCDVLGRVEARPRDYKLHVATEAEPGYLGWIGYNEAGCVTFHPAPEGAS